MKNTLSETNSNLKWWVLAVGIYAVVFLTTRLTNITTFPLYIDETTHIFVARLTENGDFFVGLSETAKQMYVWMVALAFQIFDDPIFAARAVSVFSGLITAGICYKLTNMLYPQRNVGYLAALFYLVSPFAVLFDRMALADSLLATLVGGSLLASVQLWRAPSVKWAIVLGVMFALATLNKAYAVFYYPAPVLVWLFLGRTISWRKIVNLLTVTYGIASIAWLMIFSIGFLSYQDYLLKKSITGGSEADFLLRSWHFSLLIVEWLAVYLTWPLVGLLIFVTLRVVIKWDRAGLVLIILVAASLAAFATAFTDLYSRYLFPDIVPLSVMIAWGIDELALLPRSLLSRLPDDWMVWSSALRVAIQLVLLLLFCVSAALFSYLIITEPAQAPLPIHDKTSYVTKAQSAQGYKEMAQLIEDLTQRYGKVIFLRNDITGPLEAILSVYLAVDVAAKMELVPINSFEQITPQALNSYAAQAPTLTVEGEFISANASNQQAYAQLWQVASFSSPDYPSAIGIYQWVLPPEFAIQWLRQGGDADPAIAWAASDALVTTSAGSLVDWSETDNLTPEMMQQSLATKNIEYILATPALIQQQAALFTPFITTDGTILTLKKIPPDWRLAFAYPDLNCQWCLFQLKPPGQATQITFDGAIALEGYDMSAEQVAAGESLYITLHWHSLMPTADSSVVFIHLLDKNGKLVGQIDELPLAGQWPTNRWQKGDRLADRHTLSISPTLPPDSYRIAVGLYNSTDLKRMSASAPDHAVVDKSVMLTSLSVCAAC